MYGLILPKNGCFFLLSTFEASASVGHYFLSFLLGLFAEDLSALCWLLLLQEWLSLFFFFCWLCRFLPFQSFLEVLLSWDFFSYLKLCAALRKPEEVLFRYHSSFPWNTFIDFSSSFLQSLSHNSIKLSQISFSWFAVKYVIMFASILFSRISYFSERRSWKCISDLNFSTLSSVRISVSRVSRVSQHLEFSILFHKWEIHPLHLKAFVLSFPFAACWRSISFIPVLTAFATSFALFDTVSINCSDKWHCFELLSLILLIRVLSNPCV